MPLPKDRISYLLEAYTSKTATAQEERELMEWVEEAQEDSELQIYMQGLWKQYQPGTHFSNVDWNKMFEDIMQKEKVYSIAPEPRRIRWTRIAAAAVILLLLSFGGYLYFNKNTQKQIANIETQQRFKNDIVAPQTNKAVLTLSDGSHIILDSAGNGSLAVQGNVNVVKLADGKIAYKGDATEVTYNTLTVPKGSKPVQLQLADGSEVWLNVASSITYPTAFVSNERKVQIMGEAYFEIAHDPNKPFTVSKGSTSVQVLGTHFNVNAYEDESSINITLLEGSVKVKNGSGIRVIKPGQQAQVEESGDIKLANAIDVDEVMAWKNGLFSYKGADIKSIMRQVSKWYNVEIVFESPVQEKFYAQVSRSTNISKLLEMLEATKAVHFEIDGKTIKVMP